LLRTLANLKSTQAKNAHSHIYGKITFFYEILLLLQLLVLLQLPLQETERFKDKCAVASCANSAASVAKRGVARG
jgi:hypothetical protein